VERKQEKGHNAFEEVYGDEGVSLITTRSNVIRNMSIRKKGDKTGREKSETTMFGMGEGNVPFSKWANKNESQKNGQTLFGLVDVTHTHTNVPCTLDNAVPPSTPTTARAIV